MNNNHVDLDASELSLDADSWRSRYLGMRENYRAVRKKNREQQKMSRQLIEAVKNKLEQTDRYIHEIQQKHDVELQSISKKLMYVQGCLKREQERVKRLLLERDRTIQKKNSSLETTDKKSLKKEIQCPKIERLSTTCSNQQVSPSCTDSKQTPTSNSPGNSGSTTSLDRHRPGAARLHGSFRQYKKDREKSRLLQQHSLQASNPNVSLELNAWGKDYDNGISDFKRETADLSSSSTSSSPTTLPRQQLMTRPSNHPPLRQTRSCSGVTDTHLSLDPKCNPSNEESNSLYSLSHGVVSLSVPDKGTYDSSTFPRKGILKATSSYNGSSTVTISMNNKNNTILENFSHIENNSIDQKNDFNTCRSIIESLKKAEFDEKLVISTEHAPITAEINRKSNQSLNSIDKSKSIAVGKGEKSDSGRESDECPSSAADQSLYSTSDDGLSWQSLPIVELSQKQSLTNSVNTKDVLKSEISVNIVQRHRYKHRSSLASSCSSENSSFDATYDSGLSLSRDSNSSNSDSFISDHYDVSPIGIINNNMSSAKEAIETPKVNAFHRDSAISNVLNSIRKKKPMPPPRSSMTRLTTIKSRAIAQPTKIVKQLNDKKDRIRQKVLILPNKPLINSLPNKSNVTSTPKAHSPPDPLRILKQSPLYCKILQESAVGIPDPNEHKEEGTSVQIQSARNEIDLSSSEEKPSLKAPDGPSNINSSLIQTELPTISIPSTNLNNNKESNKGSKIVPKSILHTNTHNDAAQALDLLINTNTINEFNLSSRKSSKRVKFHPEVKLSKEKEIPFGKDNKRQLTTQQKDEENVNNDIVSNAQSNQNVPQLDPQRKYIKPKKNEDISYYEPYV